VLVVDVRGRAVPVRREPRPRHDEPRLVAQDLDPPLGRVADDLALACDEE
jgi:hypothetical protein